MDASIAARDSRFGIVWLLSDTTLVTGMTVLVKMQGASYPAIQLVFIRALIGLILIAADDLAASPAACQFQGSAAKHHAHQLQCRCADQ